MTKYKTEDTVYRTVTVPAPVERAFAVFTDEFASWWPTENSFSEEEMETAIIEPRKGGRWYERSTDGKELDWGEVLEWEQPERLVLSWQISAEQVPWVPEPDPAKASKIEVRFIPEDSTTTTVELIHHDFDRHGKSGPDMHAAMNSEQGWSHLLKCYAEVVK